MNELVDIDLTRDERMLFMHGLNEYFGLAKRAGPVLAPLMGLASVEQFDDLVLRLRDAIDTGRPLSDLDWARALLLTEICWASDILGAGVEFGTNIRDERALPLLRSIQYKVSNHQRFRLVRDNAIGVLDDPDDP
jgi:hypothetical protein